MSPGMSGMILCSSGGPLPVMPPLRRPLKLLGFRNDARATFFRKLDGFLIPATGIACCCCCAGLVATDDSVMMPAVCG